MGRKIFPQKHVHARETDKEKFRMEIGLEHRISRGRAKKKELLEEEMKFV